MSLRSNKHGQVMLTSAFLLAITLTLIALMLNNIIYFNNISYMGFMDHSGYDDVSIKNMVIEESIYAYNESRGIKADFDKHMEHFIESINNLTIPKGSKVSFTTTSYEESFVLNPAIPYKSTESLLTIQTKDSIKTYTILTNHSLLVAPYTPGPGSTPLDCQVLITANKSSMYVGTGDRAEVTILVRSNNSSLIGLPGVTVDLADRSWLGGYYDKYGSTSMYSVTTGPGGLATVYYFPTNIGIEYLNASVGLNPSRTTYRNLSDNWPISVQLPPFTCTAHNVIVGTPSHTYKVEGGNLYVNISIPIQINAGTYNFSNFKAGAIFDSDASSWVQLIAPSDIANITETDYVAGPGGYTKNVYVKLKIKNTNKDYSASITVVVSANCVLDYGVYSKTSTVTDADVKGSYP